MTPVDDVPSAEGVLESDVMQHQETLEEAVDLDGSKRADEQRCFEATSGIRDLIKELLHDAVDDDEAVGNLFRLDEGIALAGRG